MIRASIPGKSTTIFQTDKQWDVYIQGEPWFAIVHGSYRASDYIAKASIVQRTHKKLYKIRFGCGRIHGQRVFGTLLRSDLDWSVG